jgi:large subunit ribosomal protein L10Ae
MGKFPTIVNPGDDLVEKTTIVRSTVKFQMKKVMCLNVAIGSKDLTEEQVLQNVYMAINFLCSLLKKNWQNVKVLYIKSSMGPSHRIY